MLLSVLPRPIPIYDQYLLYVGNKKGVGPKPDAQLSVSDQAWNTANHRKA